MLHVFFAHAFGQRYELPIPLLLFVIGGAGVVFLSFLLVLNRRVSKQLKQKPKDESFISTLSWEWATFSFLILAGMILAGIFGSQELAENILPSLFWLVVWIAVPLSCGLLGDWTQRLNPFSNISKMADSRRLRQKLLGRAEVLKWPEWLGWWPAAILYFALACGELIFNETATRPDVTALGLLVYFMVSAVCGFLYGDTWLKRGEVFSVLYSTWGKLGYFRFGNAGRKGLAGGLTAPFEASVSRIVFVLLLLISVSFDGLISTPAWSRFQHRLPETFGIGSISYELLATLIFIGLAVLILGIFSLFASAVSKAASNKLSSKAELAGLLPSLLPISFGYLIAHNIEYLVTSGQLLFPLIGNPIGKDGWPIHLPLPFNDNFEPNIHLLPSAFYWYFAVVVIVVAHIIAVFLAHQYLEGSIKNTQRAKQAEYPWVAAMIVYTMLSLWLLAQPLVKEAHQAEESFTPSQSRIQLEG